MAYFFNARASTTLEKSAIGLYRLVTYHILEMEPNLRTEFMQRFSNKVLSRESWWTPEELKDFLFSAFEHYPTISLDLFIDAHDEAQHEDEIREMICFLVDLADRTANAEHHHLSICLSSQHSPHINITRGQCIVVEEEVQHSKDIQVHVSKQLACDDELEQA